ncbi:hypothetical protein V6N13_109242 [Hibiscus sabdariffa]
MYHVRIRCSSRFSSRSSSSFTSLFKLLDLCDCIISYIYRGTVECRYHEREVQDTRPRNPGNHPPPMRRSLAHPGARHLAQLERPSLI